jgi:hypothetical protein
VLHTLHCRPVLDLASCVSLNRQGLGFKLCIRLTNDLKVSKHKRDQPKTRPVGGGEIISLPALAKSAALTIVILEGSIQRRIAALICSGVGALIFAKRLDRVAR